MATPPASKAVTESGSMACSHTGNRALTGLGTANKLTVGKKPVLSVDAGGSGAYAGCTFVDSSTNSPRPCDTTQLTSAGAGKLTVRRKPVLLTSDTLLSLSTGPPPTPPTAVTVKPGQTKLTAR